MLFSTLWNKYLESASPAQPQGDTRILSCLLISEGPSGLDKKTTSTLSMMIGVMSMEQGGQINQTRHFVQGTLRPS